MEEKLPPFPGLAPEHAADKGTSGYSQRHWTQSESTGIMLGRGQVRNTRTCHTSILSCLTSSSSLSSNIASSSPVWSIEVITSWAIFCLLFVLLLLLPLSFSSGGLGRGQSTAVLSRVCQHRPARHTLHGKLTQSHLYRENFSSKISHTEINPISQNKN